MHKFNERRRTELYQQYIGFVFQAYHLIDDLTVYENLETPLLYKKVPSGERKSRIADLLDRFNMVAKKDRFQHNCPADTAIGRGCPGFDRTTQTEPGRRTDRHLTKSTGQEIMGIFQQLNEEDGVTIIQVTHSEENARYGKRILRLKTAGWKTRNW